MAGRGKRVTNQDIKRIKNLSDQGLTNQEIALITKRSIATVKRYKNEEVENVRSNKKNETDVKNIRKAGRGNRDRDSNNYSSEDLGLESRDKSDVDLSARSGSVETGAKINFTGGKEFMTKTESLEGDIYQCHSCGHQQSTQFKHCPNCGALNEWE